MVRFVRKGHQAAANAHVPLPVRDGVAPSYLWITETVRRRHAGLPRTALPGRRGPAWAERLARGDVVDAKGARLASGQPGAPGHAHLVLPRARGRNPDPVRGTDPVPGRAPAGGRQAALPADDPDRALPARDPAGAPEAQAGTAAPDPDPPPRPRNGRRGDLLAQPGHARHLPVDVPEAQHPQGLRGAGARWKGATSPSPTAAAWSTARSSSS
jgi:hypothetical protein